MAVGASLWGLFNYTGEFGSGITKPGAIGCQYGYVNVRWHPGSEVFDKARAIGLQVADWQDVILVNMLGKRFYDETAGHFGYNTYQSTNPYEPHSLSQRQEPQIQSEQFHQCRAGRHRRRPQRRRPDLGDLRCRRRGARKVAAEAAACRCRRRFLLQRRQHRGARRQDQNEISARADAAAKSRRPPSRATIHSSMPARMPTSASRSRSTRSRSRRSMPPGRRR